MPAIKNNKKTKANKKKPVINKEVVLLKLIVLFVVLVIPIVIIVISINKQMLILQYKDSKNINEQFKNNINKSEENFNFEAPIPVERTGSMANVSQDKIDSLFNNLKE
jgi:predicted PurR-regulated permease PerM